VHSILDLAYFVASSGVDLDSPVIAQLSQDKVTSPFDLGAKTGTGPSL
jgi:hypothetical protein